MTPDGSLFAFEAPDGSLVPNDRNHAFDVFVRDTNAATIELISAHDPALPSVSPNGNSLLAASAASSTGRWLVFASEADNVVPNDTNGFRDIFVRDQWGDTNLLVSASTNGEPADGISSEPAISADGRFVVFTSAADDIAAGDTNAAPDVFLRSLSTGSTVLVSINAGGGGPGNGPSGSAWVSANGDYILFQSQASDLTTNGISTGTINLFLRNLYAGTTYALTTDGLVSASATPDGRLVAFTDAVGASEGKIYVWDTQAERRVSTNQVALGINTSLSLSPDGSRIVFLAGSPARVEFVDRLTRTNGLLGSGGYASGSRVGLHFSADSRFVTYAAAPAYLGLSQVYLYDFQTRVETRISTALGTTNGANANSDSPVISPDGRFIAYRSAATNLVSGNGSALAPQLFLYDRLSETTTLLTASRLTGGPGNNRSRTPVFSPDGHTLFFQSWAADLVPLDFDQNGDVLALGFLYVSITPAGPAGLGPTLTWPSRPGETYRVQFTDDLNAQAWQEVSGGVTVTGSLASVTAPAPSSGTRFYRVVAY
jgi:Tol biopolymer transport system component